MKLTKEECYKALRYITNLYEELYITRLKESGNHIDDTKEYWILEQLINEHFDNPPLKWEELKEEMWVWDKKEYQYLFIVRTYDDWFESGNKALNVWSINGSYDMFYEENRFYRKQVEK